MNCPVCDVPLDKVDRYGVVIDVCSGCKGVWLDRGELDKIIEIVSQGGPSTRTEYIEPAPAPCPQQQPQYDQNNDRQQYRDDRRYERDDDDRYYDPKTGRYRRRRESWLEEIFDIFD